MLCLTQPWLVSKYSNIFNKSLSFNCDVQSSESDTNHDGINDKLEFGVSIPLSDNEQINAFRLLMLFDYQMHDITRLHMESAAYIDYSSPVDGSSFSFAGELKLHQRESISMYYDRKVYNTPVVDVTCSTADCFDLDSVLKEYLNRNETTRIENSYAVWRGPRGSGQNFKAKIVIHYPSELVMFRPKFWEMVKYAW